MTNLALVVAALIMVESGGNSKAIGDNGRAVGPLQIWKCVVDDVNRIVGSHMFTYTDRTNTAKSVEIFHIYVSHYVTAKRLGRTPTVLDYIRCWNAGPNFHKKQGSARKSLDRYTLKFVKEYQLLCAQLNINAKLT